MSKYGNKRVEYAGHKFASQKERDRYIELALLEKAGRIRDLELQPKFEVLPATKGERAVNYIADFAYTDKIIRYPHGQEVRCRVVEDVKSAATAKDKTYVIKRKLFKIAFPHIEFREVL